MKITLKHHDGTDDEVYDFAFGSVTLPELFGLKEKTGLTLGPWQVAARDMDPAALWYLVGLLRQRAGRTDPFDNVTFTVDDFDVEPDVGDDPAAREAAAVVAVNDALAVGDWHSDAETVLRGAVAVLETRAAALRRDPTEVGRPTTPSDSGTTTSPTSPTSSA